MLAKSIYNIVNHISLHATGICFLSTFLSCFIIRPKFDKLFRNKVIPFDPDWPVISAIVRSCSYSGCIASNLNKIRPTKINYFYNLYDGYDFRGNANIIQIILSYALYGSFLLPASDRLLLG